MKLTKEMIDSIFEPRKEIRSEDAAPCRLLVDDKGRFYTWNRERNGRTVESVWRSPHRPMVLDFRKGCPAKGTFPVWDVIPYAVPAVLHECLVEPSHQAMVINALYKIALPRWDEIVKVSGYPAVSKATALYITERCMEFDRRVHPDVMAGGAWALGTGFSTDDSLPDWVVETDKCRVAYADTPYYYTIRESKYGEQQEYSSFYVHMLYDGGIEADFEVRRVQSLAMAKATCEEHAKRPIMWQSVPKGNHDGAWQSSIVNPMEVAA